jgi:4-amino-4-deoxy-L-arabinose transferase-like glycosyltransferase
MDLPDVLTNNRKTSQAGYFQRAYCLFGKFSVFDLLVIVICAASFGGSLIESIVNNDNAHWGWAYSAALDIKRGAIPHSEVLIFYGYIYTLIQSVALILFGERLISVGIITGLFYSFTLFLSYRVFLRFLKKSLAFIAVFLIFLIHPYIIYPFPNYFAYTFQLLGLIFFLRYQENRYNGFLSGFFLCLSVLSRYSSIIAILPPFIILLCWDFFTIQGAKKNIIKKIMAVCCGFVIPLALFFTYLFINSALDDFFYQNKMLINIMGRISDVDTVLNFVASILQIVPSYASDLRGKLFTLILIICLFVFIREIIRIKSDKPGLFAYNGYDLLAVCLVTVFGYLNSIHVYETFRLINGASLGIGLSVFVFYDFFNKALRPLKYVMIVLSVLLFLSLSSSLLFKITSSSYYPWRTDVLLHNGVRNNTIGIFKGKILTKEYNDFYQEAFNAIAPYKNSCYIINYTLDVVAFTMNDLPRIQIAQVHFPWLDDISKQARIIDERKAVILSYKSLDLPGYKKIFKKIWPDEIPWLGGGYLFIYAPQQDVPDNNIISDKKNN